MESPGSGLKLIYTEFGNEWESKEEKELLR